MLNGPGRKEIRVNYRDLREYLTLLEGSGLLKRIKAEVDLKHEIGAICARSLDRKGPGLLFENIKGYKGIPIVANILSTIEQVAIAFGTEPDVRKICDLIEAGKNHSIAPQIVEAGRCQEEVHTGKEVDLYEFPTPWWHEGDGGQYIGTTAGVITADPDTGYLNMGLYRVMIRDKNTLTVEIKGSHPIGEVVEAWRGYGGHVHIFKNEARGKATPIAIAIGMDPLLTYVGAQGVPSDSLRHAEYSVAGAWRGEAVELVKCRTNDLLVPAWAEIILEGEVAPNERVKEGPHGESQGFCDITEQAFLIHLKCITHRKSPIIYGLICRTQEDYPKFLFSEEFGEKLKGDGHISEIYVPEAIGGGLGLLAIVAAKVDSPADVDKVINAVHNAPPASLRSSKPRWLIIVDDDCDVRDWNDVMWRVAMGVMPDRDVRIGSRTNHIQHEPLANMYENLSSSIVVDATFRSKKRIVNGNEKGFPPANRVSKELMSRINARWKKYGLD